jgi:hypothetical protein
MEYIANYAWDISSPVNDGTPLADISLGWQGTPNQILNHTLLKIAHYNGASWDDMAGVVTAGPGAVGPNATAGYLEILGVASFSPFTLAGPVGALPITLKSLFAKNNGTANLISWETAIEQNVRSFIIEKSENSKDWTILDGTLPNATKRYEMKDNTPFATTYYRLKNIDNDGREQVSKVVSVQRQTGKFNISSIAPNPTFNDLTVNFENNDAADVTIQVLDIFGKIIFTQSITSEKGFNSANIHTSNLLAGSYFLNMNNGVSNVTQRFVKQ